MCEKVIDRGKPDLHASSNRARFIFSRQRKVDRQLELGFFLVRLVTTKLVNFKAVKLGPRNLVVFRQPTRHAHP